MDQVRKKWEVNSALFILTASECIKVYWMTHMDHAYPSSKHLDAIIKIGITFCVQGYFAMRKSLFVGVRRHTTSVRPGEDEGECSAVFGGGGDEDKAETADPNARRRGMDEWVGVWPNCLCVEKEWARLATRA
jgi:hypothetical protein